MNHKLLFSFERNQNLLDTSLNPIFNNFPTLQTAHLENLEMCDDEEKEYMKDTKVIESIKVFLLSDPIDLEELSKDSPMEFTIAEDFNSKQHKLLIEYSYLEEGYGGMGPSGGGYDKSGVFSSDSLDESEIISEINSVLDTTSLLEF